MKIALLLLSALITLNAQATICVAHRGNNQDHLENSMASFISVHSLGIKAVEFDVRITKDGVPIVMHDSVLFRTTKGCKPLTKIKKLNYSYIQKNCRLRNNESVPTLEDVLSYFYDKDIMLFPEFKDFPSPTAIFLMEKYYKDNPHRLGIMASTKVQDYLREQSAFFYSTKSIVGPFKKEEKTGYDGVSLPMSHLSWMSKQKDLITIVWTLDSKKKIKKALKSGVDFITTNKPRVCLYLKAQESV